MNVSIQITESDGGFSVPKDTSYRCVECGKLLNDDQDFGGSYQSSTNSSGKFETYIADYSSLETEALESIFDKIEDERATHVILEERSDEWHERKVAPKRCNLEYLENEKIALVDLSEFANSDISKQFLNDIYSLAGVLKAEELLVSVSLLSSEKSKIIRKLLVFGFEKTPEETFTTNTDVAILRIDVNQEYDFVDLI